MSEIKYAIRCNTEEEAAQASRLVWKIIDTNTHIYKQDWIWRVWFIWLMKDYTIITYEEAKGLWLLGECKHEYWISQMEADLMEVNRVCKLCGRVEEVWDKQETPSEESKIDIVEEIMKDISEHFYWWPDELIRNILEKHLSK